MSETSGVVDAMLRVMSEVGAIGKNRKAPGLNYAFRGIDDILPEIQPLAVKHGVLMTHEVIERERETVTLKSGSQMFSVRLLVRHTFRHADGSSVVSTSLGEAMDSGDKASNKAMTAALKVTLTTSFLIPTHEVDRDTEEASPEIGKPKPATRAAPPVAVKREKTAEAPISVTDFARPLAGDPDLLAREVALLAGLIQTAKSRAELDALTVRLKALPEKERDALRPPFNVRLSEVTKGAA